MVHGRNTAASTCCRTTLESWPSAGRWRPASFDWAGGARSELEEHVPRLQVRPSGYGAAGERLHRQYLFDRWPAVSGRPLCRLQQFQGGGQSLHPHGRGAVRSRDSLQQRGPRLHAHPHGGEVAGGPLRDGDIDEMFRIRAAQVPMGRGGDAWDVAYASLYLASDEAKYVTGAEIVVDGGLTVKCVERCKFLPRKSPSSSPVKSYSRSSRISAHNASAYRPGGGPRRTLGGRSGSERSIERSGSAKTVAPQAAVGYPIRARTAKKEILVDTKMTGVGKSIFRRVASILAIALAWTTLLGAQAAPAREWKWYKGNLHAHTINSDGDSTPDSVVRWYKEQRYNFLVLNDHNFVTETEGLNSIFGAKDRFLVITGEEVTSKIDGTSVYVNALNLRSTVMPAVGNSPFETLQKNIDAIQKAGGVPWLNAPGFTWSLTPKQLKQLRNVKLLEIYNGHPRVNNLGGGTFAGLEEQWDVMLSAGREFYGVAVDDAHDFKRSGPELANPGRGWICIKAPELSLGAVLDALNSGEFYASTGVELEALSRLPNGLRIKMREEDWIRYTVEFIGHGGKILKKTSDNPAEYFLQPGDQYVRARDHRLELSSCLGATGVRKVASPGKPS